MKLLNVQFSQASCDFLSLRPQYSPQLLVLTVPLNARDAVSHTYAISRVTVLWILILAGEKAEDSELNGSKA
jgi:hypothetical protein